MDTFAFTEGIVPGSNNQDAEKDTGKLPEGANKFQRAIAAWRGMRRDCYTHDWAAEHRADIWDIN